MKYIFYFYFVYFLNVQYVYCFIIKQRLNVKTDQNNKHKCNENDKRENNGQNVGVRDFGSLPSEVDPENFITIKYMTLPVDHFDKNNQKTWKGRFMENKMFFKAHSPVYLYVKGHEDLSENYVLSDSSVFDLAQNTSGNMLAIEHRYFGKSETHQDYKYLHSTQAIEDVKHLIKRIKSTRGYQKSKIVLLGEGYGGSLAVWTKQKYPELVDIALVFGALLEAKLDGSEAVENLAKIYQKVNKECADYIQKIADFYLFAVEHKMYKAISETVRICKWTDISNPNNQKFLFQLEMESFMDALETGRGGINHYCKYYLRARIIRNETESESCDESNKELSQESNQESNEEPNHETNFGLSQFHCSDLNFQLYCGAVSRSPRYRNLRSKFYLNCNEFGQFPSSSILPKPYNSMFPLEFYLQQCNCFLKNHTWTEAGIKESVRKTNEHYGGLNLNVNNVIFVVGELDPYRRFSIPNLNHGPNGENIDSSVIVDIKDEASSVFLEPPFFTDPEPLQEARTKATNKLKEWLKK